MLSDKYLNLSGFERHSYYLAVALGQEPRPGLCGFCVSASPSGRRSLREGPLQTPDAGRAEVRLLAGRQPRPVQRPEADRSPWRVAPSAAGLTARAAACSLQAAGEPRPRATVCSSCRWARPGRGCHTRVRTPGGGDRRLPPRRASLVSSVLLCPGVLGCKFSKPTTAALELQTRRAVDSSPWSDPGAAAGGPALPRGSETPSPGAT